MAEHWLHSDHRRFKIIGESTDDEPSSCLKCIHQVVCHGNLSKLCMNYVSTGSHGGDSCGSCINRYTRWGSDKHPEILPCFVCIQYAPEDSELNLAEKTDVEVKLEDGIHRTLSQVVVEFNIMKGEEYD